MNEGVTARARSWLVLAFGDERQYAGNDGYDDVLTSQYLYDTSVQNHRQVAQGDILAICGRQRLEGFARIQEITAEQATKDRLRCPSCRTSRVKRRERRAPAFRCDEGHEFDQPSVEVVPITRFTASFGDSYLSARDAIPVAELRRACHRWNGQLAIQAIELERLGPPIDQLPGFASRILGQAPRPRLSAEEARASQEESYFPTDDDTRSQALRLVRDRRGQATFRRALVERYGMQCLISGCSLLDLLEAAHIKPFRGLDDHHISNGLLLRADLHTLYDLDLIGVEPETLTVRLNPAAAHAGYDMLVGTTLRCGSLRPSRAALELRWFEFLARMPRPRG